MFSPFPWNSRYRSWPVYAKFLSPMLLKMGFLGEQPLGVRNGIFKESWLAEYSLFRIHEVGSCKLKIHLSTKLFTYPFTSLKSTLALGFDKVYFTSFKQFVHVMV